MENIQIPAVDTLDIEILMHRDIHFGKNFDIMIEYYMQDGVGVMPDFELGRMKQLKALEESMQKNISDLLLPGPAKELVERSQKIYFDLREIYSKESPDPITLLISDLILSEEESPAKEIEALVKVGKKAVDSLILLINSSDFYDPLFPGYGRAPIFAAKCLAQIGDEKAIQPLFHALGQENFFTDDAMIQALTQLGDQSKQFLLKVLHQKPLSKDNEHAAIVLTNFTDDPFIAKACFELLKDSETLKKLPLTSYLIFGCAGLEKPSDRDAFKNLSLHESLSQELKDEMNVIINSWKKKPK